SLRIRMGCGRSRVSASWCVGCSSFPGTVCLRTRPLLEGEGMKSVIWSVAVVAALVAGPVNAGTMAPRQAAAKSSDKALDESIENKIKADSSLKKYDIDVDVSDGVATLTGTVATEAERAKASQLANVSGVSRVDNRIIVDLGAASKGTAGTLKDKTKEGAEKTRETAK